MFYEYSIYAPKKDDLEEIADTLHRVWDFDPGSVAVHRGATTWARALTRRLRLLVGVRDYRDWHMFITGPKSRHTDIQLANLVDKYEGECDAGRYDFTYDPTVNYTDDQIYRYHERWEGERLAAETAYAASLSPVEREKYLRGIRDLERLREAEVATARADQEKYGYAE